MAMVQKGKKLKKTILIILGIVLSIYAIFPFYWMFVSSLKYNYELYQEVPTFIPNAPTLARYPQAFVQAGFFGYMMNSLFVAGTATIISLVLATLAGYGFARYDFPMGKTLLFGILLTYTFPRILSAIPFYYIFRQVGLLNTRASLIIVYITFSLPFAIWLMRNYFLSLPACLEESARIDGCTRMGALWRVIIPIARPAIAAASIYNFIAGWNEYMFASTFITKRSLRTLPVGLAAIVGEHVTDWGMLMAGAVICTIPIVILFAYLQRYLVTGLAAGATKG